MSKLKQYSWQFFLGLGLTLCIFSLVRTESAVWTLLPVNTKAIAAIPLQSTQPEPLIAQQTSPTPSITPNPTATGQGNITNSPLVSPGPDHIIYIGLFLLIVTAINVAGLLSQKVKSALIFSSILSVILIILLLFF